MGSMRLRRTAVSKGVVKLREDGASFARLEAVSELLQFSVSVERVEVGAESVTNVAFRTGVLWVVRPGLATGVVCGVGA